MGQGWGRGQFFPDRGERGQWQWYEFPPDHAEMGAEPTSFTWSQIIAAWRFIVPDFRMLLRIDLRAEFATMPHSVFDEGITALLHSDSLLRRELTRKR